MINIPSLRAAKVCLVSKHAPARAARSLARPALTPLRRTRTIRVNQAGATP